MKRLIVSLFIAGVLSACGPAMEKEETTAPETIESTEETVQAPESLIKDVSFCFKYNEEEKENYLWLEMDGKEISIPTIGNSVVDYAWHRSYDDSAYIIIIVADQETQVQEAICCSDKDGLQYLSFNQESLLEGVGYGTMDQTYGYFEKKFLAREIDLITDEKHNQVMVNHRSQPYVIPCEYGMDQWKKENGTVTFFLKKHEDFPELWFDYEFPEVMGKPIGSVQVKLSGTSSNMESLFVWEEECDVWTGPRFGQIEKLVSTTTDHEILPITDMEEFLVLASARPEDLARAWDYTSFGVPENLEEYEIMKVGGNAIMTVYTVSTGEKAQLALYVWEDISLVYPIAGEGFDVNYGMEIYGNDICHYRGIDSTGSIYDQWVSANSVEGRGYVHPWVIKDFEPVLTAVDEETRQIFLEKAKLPKEEQYATEEGDLYIRNLSEDGRLKVGNGGYLETGNLYFSYDDKVWRMKVPGGFNVYASSSLIELGDGEWLYEHGIDFETGTNIYERPVCAIRLKLQPDGTLTAEKWS